jgi:hypothetical protein
MPTQQTEQMPIISATSIKRLFSTVAVCFVRRMNRTQYSVDAFRTKRMWSLLCCEPNCTAHKRHVQDFISGGNKTAFQSIIMAPTAENALTWEESYGILPIEADMERTNVGGVSDPPY